MWREREEGGAGSEIKRGEKGGKERTRKEAKVKLGGFVW